MTTPPTIAKGTKFPLVSVLVTVYQRTTFLPEALKSLQSQTFRDFEVIIKDDSGSEAARDVTYANTGNMAVRYLPNVKTLGISLSLRSGLEAACGAYVAVLNDDDVWEADFLERLVPPLEEDSLRVLAFSDHWVMKPEGTIDTEESHANSMRYGRSELAEGEVHDPLSFVLVKQGVPLAMASVFRRDALDSRFLVKEVSGAYDLWISCLLAATKQPFYYVPKRLTRYRVHEQMETGRRSPDKHENLVYIYGELLRLDLFPNRRLFLRRMWGWAVFRLGRDQLYFNHVSESRSSFLRAFAISADWRPVAGYSLSLLPLNLRVRLGFSTRCET